MPRRPEWAASATHSTPSRPAAGAPVQQARLVAAMALNIEPLSRSHALQRVGLQLQGDAAFRRALQQGGQGIDGLLQPDSSVR